ncbi:glycosyltransferase family A protein [uncultured Thiohalocapsa sp.]|uniref:glycosyltransferase family 2 protein n=1 Tax=uncultured Thiohalocapsa sp. TaxID=768990 RepID=UPI0025F0197B|nr:glycosyltransferase family A protein [uncultured Thiohalocapsa sp.]
MPGPTVSVILPTSNRADTLPRALASIQAQTWQDHETIVVDDGSTDATAAVLASWARAPTIRCIRVMHGGAAAARNQGIRLARGRFIAFLDSDDRWTPDKLRRQFEVQRRTGAGVVHCDLLRILPNGRKRVMRTPDVRRGQVLDRRTGEYQTKGLGIQSVMVDACVLDRAGGFDPDLRALEDLELLLRLARITDFAAIHTPLVHYHAGPGVSTGHLAVARARRRLLHRYRDAVGASPRALALQCAKTGLAYLRAGRPRAARRYGRLALRAAPLDLRTVLPALLPAWGQSRLLALLLRLERALGAD